MLQWGNGSPQSRWVGTNVAVSENGPPKGGPVKTKPRYRMISWVAEKYNVTLADFDYEDIVQSMTGWLAGGRDEV